MTTYQTVRYLDTNGNVLGYRADTLGSLRSDWGKVYKDATSVFDRLKQSKNHAQHKTLAKALSGVNSAGAAILANDTSEDRYGDAKTVQLLQFQAGDEYNYNGYGSDEFTRLVSDATVIDSFDL